MGRVLVIREDPSLMEALHRRLDAGGHEVTFCGGDIEALQRVRLTAIDVVVTDPDTAMSEDVALAEELRLTRPGVKTIVRSPTAPARDLITAMRARVFACFTPPFDHSEIADSVHAALTADGAMDDIVVVSGLPHWLTLRVSCRLLTAERLTQFLREFESGLADGDRDLLITAFREMLLNAMEHGASFDPDKVIEVTAAKTARAIVYHFRDPGGGFTPSAAVAATSNDPDTIMRQAAMRAELGRRPGGLGLLIVRQIVDELVYNEQGNEVLLIKHLSPPA